MAVNLMVACRVAQVRLEHTLPHIGWLILFFTAVTVLVAAFPAIALWLPHLLGY
jgi:C4-dicarboxylate transporter, DctM subunit